jgi:hypothetical protein
VIYDLQKGAHHRVIVQGLNSDPHIVPSSLTVQLQGYSRELHYDHLDVCLWVLVLMVLLAILHSVYKGIHQYKMLLFALLQCALFTVD